MNISGFFRYNSRDRKRYAGIRVRSFQMSEKNKTTKMIRHDIPLRLLKALNIVLITIPFICCWYGYYEGKMKNGFYRRGNFMIIALFMLVYFIFARVYSAFLVSINRISEMVYSQRCADHRAGGRPSAQAWQAGEGSVPGAG